MLRCYAQSLNTRVPSISYHLWVVFLRWFWLILLSLQALQLAAAVIIIIIILLTTTNHDNNDGASSRWFCVECCTLYIDSILRFRFGRRCCLETRPSFGIGSSSRSASTSTSTCCEAKATTEFLPTINVYPVSDSLSSTHQNRRSQLMRIAPRIFPRDHRRRPR